MDWRLGDIDTKGYIIEQSFDCDSDNYLRWDISKPDGKIVRREVYDYLLRSVLEKLPRIDTEEKLNSNLVD